MTRKQKRIAIQCRPDFEDLLNELERLRRQKGFRELAAHTVADYILRRDGEGVVLEIDEGGMISEKRAS